jgi:hypothetical protein
MVHPAAIGCLPELARQPLDGEVEGLVEVSRTSLDPHDRSADSAGYLDPLADLGLPGILLVEELDIGSDYPVVITLDSGQFICDMLPVVIGHLDVTAPHDNVHATSWLLETSRAATGWTDLFPRRARHAPTRWRLFR